MRFETWDNYIDIMLSQVKFRFDHKDIRLEYEEHMEDKLEFLMDCGMDEERAAREVLTEMGEPESLGRALNEIHSPLLGWIWWVSKIAAKIAIAVGVFLVLYVSAMELKSALRGGEYEVLENYGDVIWQYEINQEFVIDDVTVYLDDVQLYETGCVAVRYSQKTEIFRRYPKYSFNFSSLDGQVFSDEDGNYYSFFLNRFTNGKKTVLLFEDFSPDADYLIIDWNQHGRSIYAKVPMNEAAKAGEQ
ncbi:MAG: hypothetical protein IKK69_04795 [Firmicutes bacterium]|nr:hypothetical protein [Bacillota bacterium]